MSKRRSPADLLDRVTAPDLWPDIQRRSPRAEAETQPVPRRRSNALVAAVLIAILGVGASIYALSGEGADRTEGSVAPALSGPLIAYSTMDNAPDLRIAVMRPDGSSTTRVTTGQEPDEYATRWGFSQDVDPQWSPDGQTIFFLRRYSEAIYSLCSISSSGQGFRVLVRDFPAGIFALSPTGSEVAFAAGHAIHVMGVDGSNDHVVGRTRVGFPYGVPISWSPDGARIAFASGDSQLAIVDVATGKVVILVPGYRVTAVVWDPVDRLIAFAGVASRMEGIVVQSSQVWVVRPDGTDVRSVTEGGSNWTAAGWSPDGAQLIVGRLDRHLRDKGLAVIGVDGSGLSLLQPSAASSWAAWRP